MKFLTYQAYSKLQRIDHGTWDEYQLQFGQYRLSIHAPNKYEKTSELFLVHGSKELLREFSIQPSNFENLSKIIEHGGIYVTRPKASLIGRIFQKQYVYFDGINMPLQVSGALELQKIY